jgi:hypothetical protein
MGLSEDFVKDIDQSKRASYRQRKSVKIEPGDALSHWSGGENVAPDWLLWKMLIPGKNQAEPGTSESIEEVLANSTTSSNARTRVIRCQTMNNRRQQMCSMRIRGYFRSRG